MTRAPDNNVQPTAVFLVCLAGPVIWALHFFFLYGAETMACAANPASPGVFWWMALAATLAAAVSLAVLIARPPVRGDFAAASFLRKATRLLAALALLAVAWAGLTALMLPACV